MPGLERSAVLERAARGALRGAALRDAALRDAALRDAALRGAALRSAFGARKAAHGASASHKKVLMAIAHVGCCERARTKVFINIAKLI